MGFSFRSRTRTSTETEASSGKMFSFLSSARSSISIETEKSSGSICSTVELLPSSPDSDSSESLWEGAVYKIWAAYHSKYFKVISTIFSQISFTYAIVPFIDAFEKPIDISEDFARSNQEKAAETALIISCHQPNAYFQHTLECALETFPKENIFVVENGSSKTPINSSESLCTWFGVHHIWVPISSKFASQYVGVAAAHRFRYCLMIDDDVALPRSFPLATEQIRPLESIGTGVDCVGYALEDLDAEHQSNLPETFLSRVGSPSFPHGAMTLWKRDFLEECFRKHPGYAKSPEWFLGIRLSSVLPRKIVQQRKIAR